MTFYLRSAEVSVTNPVMQCLAIGNTKDCARLAEILTDTILSYVEFGVAAAAVVE